MKTKLSLNQEAIAAFARVLVALIIVGVVGYAEVMFLQVMSRVFPDGILKIVSMLGAVATGASVLVLLVAKSYWFRPGKQMVFAWGFTGAELVVLVLNVILSFALDGGHLSDSYLSVWYTFMPASPILALLGWILILHLDQAQQDRHAELEIEVEQRQAEREHQRAVHQARMELKGAFLKSHMTYLQEEANSPELQRQIQLGASILAAKELSELTGLHIAPRLSAPAPVVPVLPAPALPTRALASAPVPQGGTTGPLDTSEVDEEWLARLNERLEQDRRQRLAQEQAREGAGEDERQALVKELLPVAAQHPVHLERIETMLGLGKGLSSRLPLVSRVERIVAWAFEHGYSAEEVKRLVRQYLGDGPASLEEAAPVQEEEEADVKKNDW
jgi:hypothetical protein